jgi:hypothetical protein
LVKFNHSSKYFNLFFIQKKGYIPLFKVLACISPGITRVIHLIKNLFRIDFIYIIKSIITVLMSHTQFNLKKSNKNLTQLLLRLAWLNLKDKHMTTVSPAKLSKTEVSQAKTVRRSAALLGSTPLASRFAHRRSEDRQEPRRA